jgi:hypothetical protein
VESIVLISISPPFLFENSFIKLGNLSGGGNVADERIVIGGAYLII